MSNILLKIIGRYIPGRFVPGFPGDLIRFPKRSYIHIEFILTRAKIMQLFNFSGLKKPHGIKPKAAVMKEILRLLLLAAVVSENAARPAGMLRTRVATLETGVEQLQSSNEELQASNAELQASFEELQASFEALMLQGQSLFTQSYVWQRMSIIIHCGKRLAK